MKSRSLNPDRYEKKANTTDVKYLAGVLVAREKEKRPASHLLSARMS